MEEQSIVSTPIAFALTTADGQPLPPSQIGAAGAQVCISVERCAVGGGWQGGHGNRVQAQTALAFRAVDAKVTVERSCVPVAQPYISLSQLGWGNYRVVSTVFGVDGAIQPGSPEGQVTAAVEFTVIEDGATLVTPTYDWQPVESWQSVPPGMEVQLPLNGTGTTKVARIPPSWQLQVFIEPNVGFLRVDVTAATKLGEIRSAAARLARAEGLRRQKKLTKAREEGDAVTAAELEAGMPPWARCGLSSSVSIGLTLSDVNVDDGLTVAQADLFAKRRVATARALSCTEDPRVVRLRDNVEPADTAVVENFASHFGLGWTALELRARLVGMIEADAVTKVAAEAAVGL